ncbi:hypothetical protein KRR55_12410 [Paeniglutamicibacter sp. ABSL32-1]|uniref:hypothetical protein n=1 Tax=Paeniglutamicibacter quisquiliarum TaxID=2849498 RepID=UPI001C2CD81A|nr:hypothetical protein [Paeniglutamicibacter quisquiliarum]MBV1779913.1 hypothetical protein [Paeniglutamicibacter quisquiliarum]
MLPPTPRNAGPDHAGALILLVFAGGSVLDAILRTTSRYSPAAGFLPQLLLAAVPLFIALGAWASLRNRRDLSGHLLLQLLLAIAIGILTMRSPLPLSWYLGIGLVLWAMRLGVNLLTWVGTGLLVLVAGAQLGLISYTGVLFLPFVATPALFLGAAAYVQWHQVRHRQQEADPAADLASELHRKRYGREPGL